MYPCKALLEEFHFKKCALYILVAIVYWNRWIYQTSQTNTSVTLFKLYAARSFVVVFQGIDDTEMFHIVAFYVSYGLAFLQLLQSLFADVAARPEFRRSHSERQPLITQTCSQVPV